MARRKKHILIVDDEENIVELIKLSLGKRYSYSCAYDGEKAREIIFEKKTIPDLIILDVMMPKLNGFELCEELKKKRSTKGIPIILVSAKVQEKDIIQGIRLGAEHYITKPFDPEKLSELVKKTISKKE